MKVRHIAAGVMTGIAAAAIAAAPIASAISDDVHSGALMPPSTPAPPRRPRDR